MTININVTGGSYKDKSLSLSAARTINFWPKIKDQKAKSPYILASYPGKKLFGTVTGTLNRGMLVHRNILYKVTDTTLYTVDTGGNHTSIATIPGSARCIMKGILSNIVIVTEGLAYVWNGSVLTQVTDSDIGTPNSCAHLNNQILYDVGSDGGFVVADVGGATSIDALNYAQAESSADDLLRVYVHDQIAYMMGAETIEPWWNSGVGKPPFDRLEGSIIEVGLGALHSVDNTRKAVYFVGNDNLVYAMKGSNAEPVFNDAIAAEISEFTVVSDAQGMCYQINGQWFYEVTFPTANRTFCHPEGGETFELASGSDMNIASSYAYFGRKHLVGDRNSGNIYQLDIDTHDENGDVIIRTRDSAPLHGGLFGAPDKMLTMTRMSLVMQAGVGTLSGQGVDPMVMISFSDDGGQSFSTEMWEKVGRSGKTQQRIEFSNLGSFYERVIRIRVSDPVYWSIHSVAADIEIGI